MLLPYSPAWSAKLLASVGPGSWLSLCSEPGVSWVTERTGDVDFGKIAQRLTPAWNRRWKYSDQANPPGGQEPDAKTAWRYSTAYFEHCFESIFGVIHRPEFEARLHAHLQPGPPTPLNDVAWYALRNIVYAAGCRQLRLKGHTDSTSYVDAQAEAFRYFQNALSVHTDLIYDLSGLEAVRALTAMTFYAEAVANESFEYMMCANAVRLAQAKGLHRQPSRSLNLPETEITHRNWLFWAIFCLEKQISFRSGRPSAIDDDHISCEIPDHAPPGSMIDVEYFKHAISIGKIITQMSRRLCSVTAMRQTPDELVNAAEDIGAQVEAWHERIGVDVFQTPGRAITACPLLRPNLRPLHIAYLQFVYYSAIEAAYAIFAFPWVASILGMEKNPSFQKQVALNTSKVADAARNIILIAKVTELDAALPQWASFYFPMSGLTNLFVYMLNSPTLPSAQADVALLDVAVGHFSHMEYLTSSERGLPFTRELANLARTTIAKWNRKSSSTIRSLSMPPIADSGDGSGEIDQHQHQNQQLGIITPVSH